MDDAWSLRSSLIRVYSWTRRLSLFLALDENRPVFFSYLLVYNHRYLAAATGRGRMRVVCCLLYRFSLLVRWSFARSASQPPSQQAPATSHQWQKLTRDAVSYVSQSQHVAPSGHPATSRAASTSRASQPPRRVLVACLFSTQLVRPLVLCLFSWLPA
jgi:hypothetical protein